MRQRYQFNRTRRYTAIRATAFGVCAHTICCDIIDGDQPAIVAHTGHTRPTKQTRAHDTNRPAIKRETVQRMRISVEVLMAMSAISTVGPLTVAGLILTEMGRPRASRSLFPSRPTADTAPFICCVLCVEYPLLYQTSVIIVDILIVHPAPHPPSCRPSSRLNIGHINSHNPSSSYPTVRHESYSYVSPLQ